MAKSGPKPKQPAERFWPLVEKTGGCWLWKGTKNNLGYGMFRFGGAGVAKMLAHRAAWLLERSEIPEGAKVLHRCDQPACVRPDHLFLGSMKDNSEDMSRKGRAGGQRLSDEQVRTIRYLYSRRDLTQTQLARAFDVSRQLIQAVVARRLHAHVT